MEQESPLPQNAQSAPLPERRHAAPLGRPWKVAGAGLLVVAILAALFFVIRESALNGNAQDLAQSQDKPPSPMFIGWRKPDLAIVVSGQMHGYLQPCGCSHPQYGGLVRRYNFIQTLKDKGWPVTAVDLGDIAQASGPHQKLKYEVSMKALKLMGYQAVGLGKHELLMPLTDALAHYSIEHPIPRPVAVNLAKTDKEGDIFYDLNVRKYHVFQAANFKVGVLGAISSQTAQDVGKSLPPGGDVQIIDKNSPNPPAPKALLELGQQRIDVGILLFHGQEKEAIETADLIHQNVVRNPAFAPLNVVVCLTREEEPPSVPVKDPRFPGTQIISIGHKGRYVGVIGVWQSPRGPEFKYQLVSMGPELETPPAGASANPVMALMDKYAEDVRDKNLLARFPRDNHPHYFLFKANNPKSEPFYAGSAECAKCHKEAHAVWANSGHAKAFSTLENAVHPKLRQFDGECVVCHTVGFQYLTGYNNPPAGANPGQKKEHNFALRNVGCESCHGPSGEHAADSKDKTLYPIINPFSARANPRLSEKTRLQRIDDFCQKCHDTDNDVHWGEVKFAVKWNKIIHMTPPKNAAQLPAGNAPQLEQVSK